MLTVVKPSAGFVARFKQFAETPIDLNVIITDLDRTSSRRTKVIVCIAMGVLAVIASRFHTGLAAAFAAGGVGLIILIYKTAPIKHGHWDEALLKPLENLAEELNFYSRGKQTICIVNFGLKDLQSQGIEFECARNALAEYVKMYDGSVAPTPNLDKFCAKFTPADGRTKAAIYRDLLPWAQKVVQYNFAQAPAALMDRLLVIQESAFIFIHGFRSTDRAAANRTYIDLQMENGRTKALEWVKFDVDQI